jgi:signal transduction histidine kinase
MRLAIALFGLMSTALASGQWVAVPTMRHWGSKEGLSSNTITALAKDTSGYLWIGSANGLYRFDGRLFEKHPLNGQPGPLLPNEHITALLPMGGRVLVGTKAGLCAIDVDGSVHRMAVKGLATAQAPSVRALLAMADGSVIATAEEPLCLRIVASEPGQAEVIRINAAEMSFAALLELKDGRTLLCANGSGLMVLDHGRLRTTHSGPHFPFPGHTMTALHPLGTDAVLGTGWDNAVHFFDLRTLEREDLVVPNASVMSYSDDEIRCSVPLPDGRFAIGTLRSGVHFLDAARRSWTPSPAVLPETPVQTMLVDSGALWIGTTEGLFLAEAPSAEQQVLALADRLPGEHVNALFRWPDGRVGVLGDRRVWRDTGLAHDRGAGPFRDAFGQLELHSTWPDNDGTLYLGSQRSVHALAPGAHDPSHIVRSWGPFDARNIASTRVNAITARRTASGTELCWSAYGHGMFTMSPGTMEPAFSMNVFNREGDHLVRSMTAGADGRIWLAGATKGLVELAGLPSTDSLIARYRDIEEGRTRAYPTDLCRIKELSVTNDGAHITATDGWDIIAAAEGGYWFSAGGNLYRFLPDTPVPFKEVVHGTGTQGITLDSSGRVWGIAAGSLQCYDPGTGRLRSFAGTLALSDLMGRPVLGENGSIWASDGKSLLRVAPDLLLRTSVPLRPRFAALSLFDQPADSLLLSQNAVLPHDQNYLFITPSVVDPAHGHDVRFRYRVIGLDERWVALDPGERIALTGIAAGHYTAELQSARGGSDRWSTATWSFTIHGPWWRSAWFIALMLATAGSGVALVLRARQRQRRRELALRDRLARDLHDDIGSTLGSISYFSELGVHQLREADIDAARGVMERMGVRSREMIGRMSDIVWSVDPKYDGGSSLAERMKLFAAETLAARDIALHFDVADEIMSLKLDMAQRRELFLVLKEAVTNAAKHAACTRVKVTIGRNNGLLRLVVEDDGKGLQRSQRDQLNGNGLGSMHKRAAALGGTLVVTDAEGGGTRVVLVVPLDRTAS